MDVQDVRALAKEVEYTEKEFKKYRMLIVCNTIHDFNLILKHMPTFLGRSVKDINYLPSTIILTDETIVYIRLVSSTYDACYLAGMEVDYIKIIGDVSNEARIYIQTLRRRYMGDENGKNESNSER